VEGRGTEARMAKKTPVCTPANASTCFAAKRTSVTDVMVRSPFGYSPYLNRVWLIHSTMERIPWCWSTWASRHTSPIPSPYLTCFSPFLNLNLLIWCESWKGKLELDWLWGVSVKFSFMNDVTRERPFQALRNAQIKGTTRCLYTLTVKIHHSLLY